MKLNSRPAPGVEVNGWSYTCRMSFPRGKVAGREDDHSSVCSAEFNNMCIYNFTSPIRLNGVVLN